MRSTTGLAQRRAAMQDTSCPGIDMAGTDMPKSATVRLELVDLDNHTALGQNVIARPPGTFKTTVQAHLNDVASIVLTVAGADRNRLVFADHSMDQHMPMCTLHNNGVPDSTPLLCTTIGLMALGGSSPTWPTGDFAEPTPGKDRA
jgi:hypothetical protein